MQTIAPETPNEELSILILPWAKAAHPDHYAATLKVAADPVKFRRYLLRLIEVRAINDRVWRNTECPLRVLDETALEITARVRSTGQVLTFRGRGAKGPIEHRLWELTWDRHAFTDFLNITTTLDLTYADPS